MLKKKLELIFIGMMMISMFVLANNFYSSYMFDNRPLSEELKTKIIEKEKEVLLHMQKNYGYAFKFPLIITDKIGGRLYGVTSYENDGSIKIYLNKKVMKESMDYILETVIAHEYAHALLFKQNNYSDEKDGHSALWLETCQNLGGINCEQYVNHSDIVKGKMPF